MKYLSEIEIKLGELSEPPKLIQPKFIINDFNPEKSKYINIIFFRFNYNDEKND